MRAVYRGVGWDWFGGEGGIRTLEGVATLPVFKTGAFNRSATSPAAGILTLFGAEPAIRAGSEGGMGRCLRRIVGFAQLRVVAPDDVIAQQV